MLLRSTRSSITWSVICNSKQPDQLILRVPSTVCQAKKCPIVMKVNEMKWNEWTPEFIQMQKKHAIEHTTATLLSHSLLKFTDNTLNFHSQKLRMKIRNVIYNLGGVDLFNYLTSPNHNFNSYHLQDILANCQKCRILYVGTNQITVSWKTFGILQ